MGGLMIADLTHNRNDAQIPPFHEAFLGLFVALSLDFSNSIQTGTISLILQYLPSDLPSASERDN